jgi:hypothetical protein
MLCLCAQKLNMVAQSMASLQLGLNAKLTATLPGVLVAARIDAKAALSAAAALTAQLPNLSVQLGPMQSAAAAAGALMTIRAGLGINPLDVKAAAELKALAQSTAAHAGILAKLPLPSMSAAMTLQAVINAILQAKAELGINLLSPTASAELAAAASAAVGVNAALAGAAPSLNAMIALALALKLPQLALGIQVGSPAGASQLSASLAMMASLKLPSIALDIPRVSMLITVAQLVASTKMALGIDLTAKGAGPALALALKALFSLNLPKLHMGPALSLSGLKAAMAITVPVTLPQITAGPLPSFTGLSMLASLVASMKAAFGVDLLAKVPCGAICPVG